MDIDVESLHYHFFSKPLVVGGKAKEYYGIRKSGEDTDLIVTTKDYQRLARMYPNNLRDLWGDLGVVIHGFEIWRTICLFGYDFLVIGAIEQSLYKIISLEKLLFLTAMGVQQPKYAHDLKLIVKKILDLQYKDFDDSKYRK
ncbi:hypothetical protein HY468_04340 [Candidatus Roizmanbacteria bacterium]|nr:hypothetical protein [Candidatus Roizmanbacteria bacterium]